MAVKEEKKPYETAELKITLFTIADVMTSSDEDPDLGDGDDY